MGLHVQILLFVEVQTEESRTLPLSCLVCIFVDTMPQLDHRGQHQNVVLQPQLGEFGGRRVGLNLVLKIRMYPFDEQRAGECLLGMDTQY